MVRLWSTKRVPLNPVRGFPSARVLHNISPEDTDRFQVDVESNSTSKVRVLLLKDRRSLLLLDLAWEEKQAGIRTLLVRRTYKGGSQSLLRVLLLQRPRRHVRLPYMRQPIVRPSISPVHWDGGGEQRGQDGERPRFKGVIPPTSETLRSPSVRDKVQPTLSKRALREVLDVVAPHRRNPIEKVLEACLVRSQLRPDGREQAPPAKTAYGQVWPHGQKLSRQGGTPRCSGLCQVNGDPLYWECSMREGRDSRKRLHWPWMIGNGARPATVPAVLMYSPAIASLPDSVGSEGIRFALPRNRGVRTPMPWRCHG